jgi:hypothetical protein
MRSFIFLLATTAGSAAFQMSVAVGYITNFAWAVPWAWALCVALWVLWLITHDKVKNEWLPSFHNRAGGWVIVLRIALFVVVFFFVGSLGGRLIKKPVANIMAKVEAKQETQQPEPEEKKAKPAKTENAKKTKAVPKVQVSGGIKQGGNGDCQANAIGGNATVENSCNNGPPEPKLSWSVLTRPQPANAKHPRTYVIVWLDRPLDNAVFRVVCDRSCIPIETGGMPGVTGANFFRDTNLHIIAIFDITLPNPFPANMGEFLGVESVDDEPVRILNVEIHKFTEEEKQAIKRQYETLSNKKAE